MIRTLFGLSLVLLSACQRDTPPPTETTKVAVPVETTAADPAPAAVNRPRALAAERDTANWLMHGRTYDEQRFSPLESIDQGNVAGLGLDWYFDFPTGRGMEATPIVVDGKMYTTSTWSMVYAFDAASGEPLWHYDPKVPKAWGKNLCCDAVNRGVAVWEGKVFVGTLDGRLEALDAASGAVLWSVQTTPTDKPYSITGAPRIVDGKVIIGNGGGEFGVRGYVSAYAADSGEMLWRFYTVPGNPADGFESPVLEKAAETWLGGQWWTVGGGGTVWDSMAYDPELDLLYVGVGNGSPWNRQIRSPGGGDNLFLSSIVALRPDTGEYVWHFQTTPGESWDYTATQHMILADLEIDGELRKVIMQAPKNGFFYVLDRATGEFISGEKYVNVTWAEGLDPQTGRPILTENARYEAGDQFAMPSPHGGHNWHPMSYSPQTGLVYIPAQDIPFNYRHDADFVYQPGYWNTGIDVEAASLPDDEAVRQQILGMVQGRILAWDPVRQQEAWRVEHGNAWNGGVLATAGNLVFQGNANGEFVAYRADNGERLWATDAQTGIVAGPISYMIDGKQYVAVSAGWGGALPLAGGAVIARAEQVNRSRLLVFSLDGDLELPEPKAPARVLDPPPLVADAATVARGRSLFAGYCMVCHGDGAVGGGVIPDLRYMSAQTHAEFDAIVVGGLRHERGMAGFGDRITPQDSQAIRAYLIERAHRLKGELAQASEPEAAGEGA
jgi:quinohemoprotein ethanol dehydrogenase